MKNMADQILEAARTSMIDINYESKEFLRPKLLYNDTNRGNTVLACIESELQRCSSFWFSVAFVTKSGLIAVKETLKEITNRGIVGQILTTDYLAFNEPDALRDLLKFSNIEVRVYTREMFHTKGYMFKSDENHVFIVGSSNMTQGALKSNKEWNIKITSMENGELIKESNDEFTRMWNEAEILCEDWILHYEEIYLENRKLRSQQKEENIKSSVFKPNSMQIEATRSLANLRAEKKNKALLISATGASGIIMTSQAKTA